ncbi:MAG: hypothetical protein AB1601_06665 [Planctomycetota bacterium]
MRAALVVVALLGSARGNAQELAGPIPDEVAAIAAACRENSARIGSLQVSGTVVMAGRRLENQWDPIAKQMYHSRTQQFAIWKDAVHCRFDVVTDRTVNELGEVNYSLPAGEHITSYAKLEREGGLAELKRKHGTPQSTERRIVTPAARYWYMVESNRVSIGHYNQHAQVNRALEMRLAMNKVCFGWTMAELVDQWAALLDRGSPDAPRLLEAVPLDGGQYRVRTISENGTESGEIVADLNKGGNILSYVLHQGGRIVSSGRFDYANAGGAWVLAHGEVVDYGPDGVVDVELFYEAAPESIRVNEPIDPQVFTWEALDVRKGAQVVDLETGEEYLYDDIPLHLKVALAIAREKEEEAAEAAARASATAAPAPAEPAAEASASAANQPVAPTIASTARELGPTATRRAVEPTDHDKTPEPGKSAPLPPESRPATTRPTSTRPATTRPAGPAPLPEAVASPRDDAVPPPAETAERRSPATTATVVAISAGCVAALGIGLWKLARRGPRPGVR